MRRLRRRQADRFAACSRSISGYPVGNIGSVARPTNRRIRFAYRNCNAHNLWVVIENLVCNGERNFLDQIKLVTVHHLFDECINAFVVDGLGEVVSFGGSVHVEVHSNVHFKASTYAMFFLHNAVVGVENGIDKADGSEHN